MRRRGYYCAQACSHPCYRILVPLSFALLVCAISALPALAKIPGKVHCYRDVCHRVMSIAETERLIDSARTIITTYYDDPGVDRFNRGELTSSGERFDANNPGRAASSNFPDGTELLIWNPRNGRAGHVRINDFGPFHTNRTLDVTRALGEHLGMTRVGVRRHGPPYARRLTISLSSPPEHRKAFSNKIHSDVVIRFTSGS